MSDEQEDDVALDGGMEPELSIEDLRAGRSDGGGTGGGDSGDEDDDEPAVEGDRTVTSRGKHVISPKVRELFKKASQAVKAQLDEEGDESPFGEYDEGAAPKKQTGLGTTKVISVEQDAGKVELSEAAKAPPVAQQSAEADAFRAQLDARRVELDEREQRITAAERAGDMAQVRARYFENGAPAIRDLVKGWLGKDATEDDLKQEVADLITDLSVQVLGVDVPSEVRAKIDTKRALRSVKVLKDSINESEAAKAKRLEAEQQEQGRKTAINALNQEIRQPTKDYAKQYPFLMAEDDPGDLIYRTAQRQHEKDGTILQWTEAAKRVDDYLRKQASDYYDKRKHLFSAAPATAGVSTNGTRERPQGDPQGIRRSHTLTSTATGTTTPTKAPDEPPSVVNGKWSREAHRASTRSKFRNAFKSQPEE